VAARDKILKLVRLATDPGATEAEARTAALLACRLMAEADVLGAPPPPPVFPQHQYKLIHVRIVVEDNELVCDHCGAGMYQQVNARWTSGDPDTEVVLGIEDLPRGWRLLCEGCAKPKRRRTRA
jgi:hypothetical protein